MSHHPESQEELIHQGCFHYSDVPVAPHQAEITSVTLHSSKLLSPGESATFICKSKPSFINKCNVVITFREFSDEGSLELIPNFFDRVIKNASFKHGHSDVSMSLSDANVIEISNNFINKGREVYSNKDMFVGGKTIIVPLVFPFTVNNDFSFPLLFHDKGKTSDSFEISLKLAELHTYANYKNKDGALEKITQIILNFT